MLSVFFTIYTLLLKGCYTVHIWYEDLKALQRQMKTIKDHFGATNYLTVETSNA